MSHEDQMQAFMEGRSPDEKAAYLSALSRHERAMLLHTMSSKDLDGIQSAMNIEYRPKSTENANFLHDRA